MKLNINQIFLLFVILFFTTSCGVSPLLPILNERNGSRELDTTRPISDKYNSIWNTNSKYKNTTTPNSPHTPSLNELLNPEYAWIGNGSIINNKDFLFIFDKDKYTGNPIVYFSAIDTIFSEPYYKLYEQRSFIPTTMYYVDGNAHLVMSTTPVFFVPEYDNFMNNNFSIVSEDHTSGYTINISPSPNPIRRDINSSIGEKITSYMPINNLKNAIIGKIWYPVASSNSKAILSEGINYMFMDNREVSTSKGLTAPSGSPTTNKGWDVWRYEGYDDVSTTNYIYVYDYVYVYIENNHYITDRGNTFDVMYFFNEKRAGVIPSTSSMLKYSLKP